MKKVFITLLYLWAGCAVLSAQNNAIWGYGNNSGYTNTCAAVLGFPVSNGIWSSGNGSGAAGSCAARAGFPVSNGLWAYGGASGATNSCAARSGFPVSNGIWGYGTSSGANGYCLSPAVPLPVQVLSFKARLKNRSTVDLQWKVASELNLASYLVQRSYDMNTWSDAVNVLPKLSFGANGMYTAQDIASGNASTIYYRLIPIDADGTRNKMLYDVVRTDQLPSAVQYNNPVSESLNIAIPGTTDGRVSITLYTLQGSLVKEFEGSGSELSFNIADLPPSCYIVQVTVNGETAGRFKIIKQ